MEKGAVATEYDGRKRGAACIVVFPTILVTNLGSVWVLFWRVLVCPTAFLVGFRRAIGAVVEGSFG